MFVCLNKTLTTFEYLDRIFADLYIFYTGIYVNRRRTNVREVRFVFFLLFTYKYFIKHGGPKTIYLEKRLALLIR